MPSKARTHNPFPKAVKKSSVDNRQSASKRGYDGKWRKSRLSFLHHNPLCVHCQQEGKIRAATDVDHIIPHKGDYVLFWDKTNWQALCHSHHSIKTASENQSGIRASMLPKWMPLPSKPLIHVCGPPASGKTTYVSENADATDLVLDLDVIAEETGTPLYLMDEAQRNATIRLRNARLADFCKGKTDHPRCWLIATSGSFKRRKFWADHGAETVVINPGAVVCKQRIQADTTRPDWLKASRCLGADKWE